MRSRTNQLPVTFRSSLRVALVVGLALLGGCDFIGAMDFAGTGVLRAKAELADYVEQHHTNQSRAWRAWAEDFLERRVSARIGEPDRIQRLEEELATSQSSLISVRDRLRALNKKVASLEVLNMTTAAHGATTRRGTNSGSIPSDALKKVQGSIRDLAQRDAIAAARLERLENRQLDLDNDPETGAEPKSAPGPGFVDDKRGFVLHLASYRVRDDALRGWKILARKYDTALAPLAPVFSEVDTIAGPFIRLSTGAGLPRNRLRKIRDEIRAGGDFASIILPKSGV